MIQPLPKPDISVSASGGPQKVSVDPGSSKLTARFSDDKFEAAKLTMARAGGIALAVLPTAR